MTKRICIALAILTLLVCCVWLMFFSTEFKRQLFLAKRGQVDAQVFIATAYATDPQIKDLCASEKWWQQAAQSDFSAKQHLGDLIIASETPLQCINLNQKQYFDYLLYATEKGNYAGYAKLAEIPQLSTEQKIQYLENGALHNEPNALYGLAPYYFHLNQAYTLYLLEKAAQLGHSKAQTFLADIYAGMTYTQKHIDYPQAIYWYTQAAKQNNLTAQKNLGLLYLYGQGSAQNYDQAAYWLKQASKQQDKEASLTLAMLVLFDRGLTSADYGSKTENFKFIQQLAQQGYIDAQVELGRLNLLGIGTLQDYHQAAHWFQLAANQSDRLAKYQLGQLYSTGQGVPQNIQKAEELFYQARYTEYIDTSKANGTAVIDEGYPKFKAY